MHAHVTSAEKDTLQVEQSCNARGPPHVTVLRVFDEHVHFAGMAILKDLCCCFIACVCQFNPNQLLSTEPRQAAGVLDTAWGSHRYEEDVPTVDLLLDKLCTTWLGQV